MAEITLDDPFGRAIHDTIIKYDYHDVLEIGSWDGTGSSLCILNALNRSHGTLDCLEIDRDRCIHIADNVRWATNVVTRIFNISSIRKSDLIDSDFETVWSSPHNQLQRYGKLTVQSWHERTCAELNNMSFLNSGLDKPKYDAVLIDGGEFTGYSEYIIVKDRTRCLMLDDVHKAFKCNRAYNELRTDDNWELIFEDPEVRNGFAIFVRHS